MATVKENMYAGYRQEVKERIRRAKKEKPTDDRKPNSSPPSFRKLLSAVDYQLKLEKIRASRDYSFLFSPDADDTSATTASPEMPQEKKPMTSLDPAAAALPRKSPNNVKLKALAESRKKPTSRNAAVSSPRKPPISRNGVVAVPIKKPPVSRGAAVSTSKTPTSRNAVVSSESVATITSKPACLGAKKIAPAAATLVKRKRRLVEDDEEEYEAARAEIRRMFNTKRFEGVDDSDRCMEASYGDIVKEENRSTRLARKEDREQQLLIEKALRLEREAKKQKIEQN